MSQFDVSLVHRLSDDLENVAKSMKERVSTPVELQDDITQINSILGSLQTLVNAAKKAGSNPLIEENMVK